MSEKTCLACKHSFVVVKAGDRSACLDCNADRNMHTPIQSTDTETLSHMHTAIVPAIVYECERDKVARLTSLLARMREVGDELLPEFEICGTLDNPKNKCQICRETWGIGADEIHTPDCPVTKWEEIKKEINHD